MNANPLTAEIARAKQLETVAMYERNEAALAEKVTRPVAALSEGDQPILIPFAQWATQNRVRYCPAKPTTVAAFIAERAHLGEQVALDTAAAIARLHDVHGLSNPVATATVAAILDAIVKCDPPRSWPKEDKARFSLLPADIREVIGRRERERDRALRRQQNELRQGTAAESAKSKEATNG